jgi:hypothetical protein
MSTYVKRFLSGSTNGRPIRVAATGTGGTTLHTAGTGTTNYDEVYIYAVNVATSNVDLTIELGGTTSSDGIPFTVPSRDGLYTIIPGLPLNNGLIVKAFVSATDSINIVGFVNRRAT